VHTSGDKIEKRPAFFNVHFIAVATTVNRS